MKIIDISVPIYEGMPVYKNKQEKQPKITRKTNGHVTESKVHMDLHTGTHIDAPLHMINDGATFEAIPIEKLIGSCKVFDFTYVNEGITAAHLQEKNIAENDFVLLKTKNSNDDVFNPEFIFLTEDGAIFLAEKKVRGVGIDALGVERNQANHPTHKTLFSNLIIVIEGLQLKNVEEGEYTLIAAPLKFVGTDASPARVLLITDMPPLYR